MDLRENKTEKTSVRRGQRRKNKQNFVEEMFYSIPCISE